MLMSILESLFDLQIILEEFLLLWKNSFLNLVLNSILVLNTLALSLDIEHFKR